jgi:hypothetical protein
LLLGLCGQRNADEFAKLSQFRACQGQVTVAIRELKFRSWVKPHRRNTMTKYEQIALLLMVAQILTMIILWVWQIWT